MTDLSALLHTLGIIDCAVLKHTHSNQFELVYRPHDWINWLLPQTDDSSPFVIPESSPFLTDFLIDAEMFWAKQQAGKLHSGIWSEDCYDNAGEKLTLRLEAIAACANKHNYLVINNIREKFELKQSTLQTARELLISHEKVLAQHDLLSKKLPSVLKKSTSPHDLCLPIKEAIQNTSVGVIITDSANKVLFKNSATKNLFEADKLPSEIDQHKLILDLLVRQYPESEEIFLQQKAWSGELYWHYPPAFHKWLQATIAPVIDDNRNVCYWIFTLSDNTRVKYLLENNEKLALYDVLTGLPNRQYFWQTLEQRIVDEARFHLLYIDMHQFKKVNEQFGHSTGDSFLEQAAARLEQLVDTPHFIARIGTDEFAVIMNDNTTLSRVENQKHIMLVSEQICSAFKQPFYTQNDNSYTLSAHIGIAHYPEHASQADQILKSAYIALEEARTDANLIGIQFYSHHLQKIVETRYSLEQKLRYAIEFGGFQLFLQPIIDLQTDAIVKAEALLRWQLSENEWVAPDTFIPIAERTGLIIPLGKWVISEVCRLLAEFAAKDINIKLTINLSPSQVSDANLLDFIKAEVNREGVNPQLMELELTEGVLVDDYDKAMALLSALREFGVTIAIDDFGTGYSSLSYLKHLPIDDLKIDRSFIFDIDKNEDDKAIVLAVLAMAKQLQLNVIAEGVETKAHRDFLRENHCALAQGYYYSRPVPIEQFYGLL